MEIKLKKDRVLLERIRKESILTSKSDQNYDYEDYKFKVVKIGVDVEDKELVGKTIVKQKALGIPLELENRHFVIIREEDIIAEL